MKIEFKNIGKEEIFLPIKDYETKYLVSNFGNIKSIEKGRNIYLRKEHYGYITVELSNSGDKKRRKVHRLVATAFLPNPKNLKEVNHKDGNKENNNLTNLEWVSPSQNTLHAVDKGLAKRKLSPEAAVNIFKLFHQGKSEIEIAVKYNVKESTIKDVLKGKTWTRFHGKVTNENGLYKVNDKRYHELSDSEKEFFNQFIKEFKTH